MIRLTSHQKLKKCDYRGDTIDARASMRNKVYQSSSPLPVPIPDPGMRAVSVVLTVAGSTLLSLACHMLRDFSLRPSVGPGGYWSGSRDMMKLPSNRHAACRQLGRGRDKQSSRLTPACQTELTTHQNKIQITQSSQTPSISGRTSIRPPNGNLENIPVSSGFFLVSGRHAEVIYILSHTDDIISLILSSLHFLS